MGYSFRMSTRSPALRRGLLLILGARGRFNAEYFTPVDLVGLYWHVVDLIWIFLFPMFYLIH